LHIYLEKEITTKSSLNELMNTTSISKSRKITFSFILSSVLAGHMFLLLITGMTRI